VGLIRVTGIERNQRQRCGRLGKQGQRAPKAALRAKCRRRESKVAAEGSAGVLARRRPVIFGGPDSASWVESQAFGHS
jgi:hypothetical protein